MTQQRNPTAWVVPTALVMTAAHLAIRGWVGFTGYFSLDDYVFYTRAAELPLWSRELLLTDYNGHLMPGSMVWVWVSTRLAPLELEPVVITSLALQLVIDLLMLLLLRRLFGLRPAILVPYAVFVFSTLGLPAMVWWAAALNQLPQQLFMLLALLAHLRYLRTERWRDALLTALPIACGLAFSEKTTLTVPLIFAFTWLIVVGGPLVRGLAVTVRRYRVQWMVQLVLVAAYAVYYVTEVESPARGGVTLQEVIETLDIAGRRTVVPGLVGGPWSWQPLGVVDSLAAPSVVAQVVAAVLVGSVIGYSVWLSRGAARAWALLGLGLYVEAALLLVTRVQVVGVEAVAAEYRYFTDLGIVAALALGLAYLPLRAEVKSGRADLLAPRAHDEQRLKAVASAVHLPSLAVVGVVGLLLSGLYSATTYQDRWSANPGRDYFANAQGDLAATPAPVTLYNGPVPGVVVWRLLWPATLPSRLLPPTGVEFRAFRIGESTHDLRDLAADGHLRPSTIQGIELESGPERCGWPVSSAGTTIPLDTAAFNWNWVVRLDYTATDATDLELSAGDTTVTVPLRQGADSVFVFVTGAVADVEVRTLDSADRVCIEGGTVGLPQPVEW